MAHRYAVERRKWLSEAEFADIVTLCQFMPGPNVVGLAVCIGAKTRGTIGTLAAVAGFIVIPGAMGFAIAVLALGHAQSPLVQRALSGISAAAAGLMIATGLRLLRPHRRDLRSVLVAIIALAALAFAKLPLLLVLAVLAPASVAATILLGAKPR